MFWCSRFGFGGSPSLEARAVDLGFHRGQQTVTSSPAHSFRMSKTILLAEDSLDDEILFRRVMNSLGVINPIHVVRDGKEAITYLQGDGEFADRAQFPLPVALFLDLKMPGADGWAVLKWLSAKHDPPSLLVIVLTAFGDHERLQEAYQLGANSFLFKPLKPTEMTDILHHWPEVWMRTPLRGAPPPLPPTSGTQPDGGAMDAAL